MWLPRAAPWTSRLTRRSGGTWSSGGGTATVAGRVGRDLTAGVSTLDLRGRVERNVKAEVTNLRPENGASVGGSGW
jgi:hypothetical protein